MIHSSIPVPRHSPASRAVARAHPRTVRQHVRLTMLRLLLAAGVGAGALAAWSDAHAQAAAQRSGSTVSERREAAAAAVEGPRGNLADKGQDYKANALQRCARLPGDQRSDCEARVRGEGEMSGSVRGGGILRQTTTTTISPAPAPAAPGAAPN